MLTLMTAALVAAQPAPAANPPHAHMPRGQTPHGEMAPMQHQHHQAMMKTCPCCRNIGKHDGHGPAGPPQQRRGH